ncbi:PIH1 domain-containing protein 1 [Ixodes scapularis]
MSKNNAFLEVPDDSEAPFESLFLQANAEFKNLVQTLAAESADTKTKPIKPSPGFCIKLRDTDGSKLFINVCHTPELPEPREISEEELMQILESEDPTSYRVPLSLGLPHEELDKGGNPCKAFDVIINDAFFRKIESNELFRTFVITVAIDGIEDKYGASPDRESYTVLKNRRYVGSMPDHHIQNRKGPLIAELDTKPKAEDRQPSGDRKAFPVQLTRHSGPGVGDTLVARFSLPGVKSGGALTLDVGEDRVVLGSKDPQYSFDFFVPHCVDQEAAVAEFDTRHHVLTVTMPLLPSQC